MGEKTDQQPGDKMLTIPEVADQLGISQRAVWRLVASSCLRSHKFGRSRRVRKADLDAFIRSRAD